MNLAFDSRALPQSWAPCIVGESMKCMGTIKRMLRRHFPAGETVGDEIGEEIVSERDG